jgi:hypothetical protein
MKRILKPKAVRISLMATLLAVTLAGWVGAAELDVPQRYQLEQHGSWVGCTQALSFYYGVWLTQPQIAGRVTRRSLNGKEAAGQVWMGLDEHLRYFTGVESITHKRAFTPEEVSEQMAAGHPVVIRWDWAGGGGHLLILRGIDRGVVSVMDPWLGPTLIDYDWLVRGGNHTWTHTLELTADPGPRRLAPFLLMLMKAH